MRDNASPITERIRWLLKRVWLGNQSQMAEDTGVSQAAISHVVLGRCAPGDKVVKSIAAHPFVNAEWLITGQGEPLTAAASGDQMLPLARQMLPGQPDGYRELLTGEHLPTTRFDYRTTRYWLSIEAKELRLHGLELGDRVLIETEPFWLKRPAMLQGCPSIVRGPGDYLLFERLEFQPRSESKGIVRSLDRPPERHERLVRMDEPIEEAQPKSERPRRRSTPTRDDADDPTAVRLKDIVAVGILLQRRW